MRRLYFLVPDIPTARKIVDDLLLARISERHLHVLAKRGTPLEDLPEAGVLQKTNLVHALERGVALGGASGLLAGLVAITTPVSWKLLATTATACPPNRLAAASMLGGGCIDCGGAATARNGGLNNCIPQ